MSSRVRKAVSWAVVSVVGAGLVVLWAGSRVVGGEAITAAGSALSGAADSLEGSGTVHGGAEQVAAPYREMPRQELLTSAVGPGAGDAFGASSMVPRGAAEHDGAGAATDGAPSAAADESSGDDSAGVTVVSRAAAVSGCAGLFNSPGEQLTLSAAGFAEGATVSLSGHAASLGETTLSAPVPADATADADGVVEVSWFVPSAPAASVDAAPRGYALVASGANAAGGTHTAMMIEPLVAYPAAVPCAVADTASATLGTALQVSVLGNDMAPTGGSLDKSTVVVRAAVGGVFSVDATTGVVAFAPDAGFWGTVETSYVVYDGWGIGVQADLSVTVDAGCTVTGVDGVTLIEGTDGDDVLCVPDRDDWRAFHIMDGKGGDDTILGGDGTEWIYGGDGADTIYGNGGDDQIVAGAGVDTVYGGTGMDVVLSVDTADVVIDDDYEMILSPSVTVAQSGPEPAGDWAWAGVSRTVLVDVLANDHDPNEDLDPSTLRITADPASGAAVVAQDVDGRPVVSYATSDTGGTVSFDYEVCDSLGACAAAEVTVMVGTAGCTVVGTDGDDTLSGTSGDDVICGLGGDDTIYGLDGDDVIVGGEGADTLYGGNRTLIGARDGDDIIWGGAGDDTLYGGNGNDALWGGDGDDFLYGNRREDRVFGGPGDDTAVGGGETDLIWGGPGTDTLDGHAGDDTVWGGPGADTLRGGNGDDALWGGNGDDVLRGNAGADRLHGGAGADTISGGTQNDALWGGPGADTLDGQGHDDELYGGPGADTLRGGNGDDRLWGGIDADTLDGGNGTDHADGGPDTDTCQRTDTTAGCE